MANVKINDLSAASAVTGSMQMEVDTGGTTSEKITVTQLLAYEATQFPFRVTFFDNGGYTFTNLPSTEQWLSNTASLSRTLTDLGSVFTEVRMSTYLSTAGSTGSYLRAKYATTDTATLGSYSNIGTSVVEIALDGSAGIYQTSWISLASGAKISPCYIGFTCGGGNSTADPVIRFLYLEFR
jgi:hypothetical protein